MGRFLLTGGLGYIGSHTAVELAVSGHEVVVVDNLSNSKKSVLGRLEKITGRPIRFYEADVRDKQALKKVFQENEINCVVHFAGLKAVGESVAKPLEYYRNNLDSTLSLCEAMREHGVKKLIFSSSATVYGTPSELPLRETSQVGLGITNPYGQTKFMIEQILSDICKSDEQWHVTTLRYFNPIGAHESGLIGEDPSGLPNNLIPYVAKVACGELDSVGVFGNDYDTTDGTGVRDYIHVVDLARGHIAASQKMSPGFNVYNLGTGKGVSVLEVIKAYEDACGHTINYQFKPRRPGDIAECYADSSKANQELNWQTKKSLNQACEDSWRWILYAKDNRV